MSLLTMIQGSGNVVTRRVSAAVFQWMLAVSAAVGGLVGSGAQAQTVYVFKNGNDTTGDGSFGAPFLTIQRALTSVTTASAALPFTVQVGPGVYTDTFQVKAWTYIKGISSEAVFLNPVTANWIDASFAAGTQDGGIEGVTFLTSVTVNFNAIASTGAGSFRLADCFFGAALTLTAIGNNAANIVHFKNLGIGATGNVTLLMTSISSNLKSIGLRNGGATFNHNADTFPYTCIHRATGLSTGGVLTVAWTGTTPTTLNSLTLNNFSSFQPVSSVVITGGGAALLSAGKIRIAGPDANTTFSFGLIPNGGTLIGIQGGLNEIDATPTADRTYTFEGGGFTGGGAPTANTQFRIINRSQFYITIAYAGGASGVAGRPTYVGPNQSVDVYAVTQLVWEPADKVQSGTVTLSNGVSALIPADVSSAVGVDIVASLRDINGGTLGAMVSSKLAGRVAGVRGGGGGFVLTSVSVAGATVATDQGIYDWHIVG